MLTLMFLLDAYQQYLSKLKGAHATMNSSKPTILKFLPMLKYFILINVYSRGSKIQTAG